MRLSLSRCRLWVVVGILGLSSTTPAAERVKVFVLAGQSNMVGLAKSAELPEAYRSPRQDVRLSTKIVASKGPASGPGGDRWGPLAADRANFGPEIGFGPAAAEIVKGERVAIVKFARSGANLYEMFNPDATAGLKLYPAMIAFVQEQVEFLKSHGDEVELAGVAWYQGEADSAADDANAAAFEQNLRNLVARVRKDLGKTDLPFVAVRVNPRLARHKHRDEIRTAIEKVMAEDPHGAWVDVDDLSHFDQLHLDATAQIEAGKRIAAKWKEAATKGKK